MRNSSKRAKLLFSGRIGEVEKEIMLQRTATQGEYSGVKLSICFIIFQCDFTEEVGDKDGTCPEANKSDECPPEDELRNLCLFDTQCSGAQKCCSDGCIFKCVDPVKSETDTEGFYSNLSFDFI